MIIKIFKLVNSIKIEYPGTVHHFPKNTVNIHIDGNQVQFFHGSRQLTPLAPITSYAFDSETISSIEDLERWIGEGFFINASTCECRGTETEWYVDADGKFDEGVTVAMLDQLFPNPILGQTFISVSTRYMVTYMGYDGGNIWKGELFTEL